MFTAWGSDGWPPRWQAPQFYSAINLVRPRTLRAAIITSYRLRQWGQHAGWEFPLIHISSNAVFERPLSRYGMLKIVQETLLRDIAFTIRLPHMYGKGVHRSPHPCVLERWLYGAEAEIVVDDPDREIDFLPVGAFVDFTNTVLDKHPYRAGESINLGSGQRRTLLAWAEIVHTLTDKPLRIAAGSPHPTRLLGYSAITVQEAMLWGNPIRSTIGAAV